MKNIYNFVVLVSFLHLMSADYIRAQHQASFVPLWAPQAQFAGFYVAFEKGFYKREGIDLKIIHGGPNVVPSEYLEKKKTDFALLWLPMAIEVRSKGIKLVNISQIVKKSALMLIARKSSGIKKLEDLNGKNVSVWRDEFQLQPLALIKKNHLKVRIVPQSFSINLFISGVVDVTSAMWYNEYHTIINSGYDEDELVKFFYYDYEMNSPEDGIYVLESKFKEDPELCKKFVKASFEGWKYAFANPNETLEIIIKYLKSTGYPVNKVHQRWMLKQMKDLIFPEKYGNTMGFLAPQDYNFVSTMLKENGLLKESPKYEVLFKDLSEANP